MLNTDKEFLVYNENFFKFYDHFKCEFSKYVVLNTGKTIIPIFRQSKGEKGCRHHFKRFIEDNGRFFGIYDFCRFCGNGYAECIPQRIPEATKP